MANFDRKLELWRLLRGAPDGLGLRDLASRLGVSKNTVQRDVDELSRSGVAVEEERKGQALRYFIRSTPAPELRIGPREMAALSFAEAALAPYGMPGLSRALSALRTNADTECFERSPEHSLRLPRPEVLEALLLAIPRHSCLRILYKRRGVVDPSAHEIEPHALFLNGGLVYLRARVPPHRGLTTFAAHLIESIETLPLTFRPRRWRNSRFRVFEDEPRPVEVRFAPDVACYIAERRWHPTQRLEAQADGGLILRARLSGEHEFIGWLLSWSPYAELIAPRDWRDNLRARATRAATVHAGWVQISN
jgi:predicted DNA-binding transcriptional regulator YafY